MFKQIYTICIIPRLNLQNGFPLGQLDGLTLTDCDKLKLKKMYNCRIGEFTGNNWHTFGFYDCEDKKINFDPVENWKSGEPVDCSLCDGGTGGINVWVDIYSYNFIIRPDQSTYCLDL